VQSGLGQMRRTLRENEPPRLSKVLTTLAGAELKTHAEHRQVEPPKLISMLTGDLDWIVMKTLEKDRSRRYETVDGLLMDVQRYLSNEPVRARPPSQLYRLRNWCGGTRRFSFPAPRSAWPGHGFGNLNLALFQGAAGLARAGPPDRAATNCTGRRKTTNGSHRRPLM